MKFMCDKRIPESVPSAFYFAMFRIQPKTAKKIFEESKFEETPTNHKIPSII